MACFFFSGPTGFNSFLNILGISLNICQSSINIPQLKVGLKTNTFFFKHIPALVPLPKPKKKGFQLA